MLSFFSAKTLLSYYFKPFYELFDFELDGAIARKRQYKKCTARDIAAQS